MPETRRLKGGPKYLDRNFQPSQVEKELDTWLLQLFVASFPKLGHLENIFVREDEEIEKFLHSIKGDLTQKMRREKKATWVPIRWTTHLVFLELNNFFTNGLYTSAKAVRDHFRFCENLDEVMSELGLEEGQGFEIPERDMPPDVQGMLLQIMMAIMERTCAEFLQRNLGAEFKKEGLVTIRDFEMCRDRREDFFDTEQCLEFLECGNSLFSRKEFRQLMADATDVRNTSTHRKWCTVAYLCDAANIGIDILQTLGEGYSPNEAFLQDLLGQLEAWRCWSNKDKKETLDELRKIFTSINGRQANNSKVPVASCLPEQGFKDQKDKAVKEMLMKRQDDRAVRGRELILKVLKILGPRYVELIVPFQFQDHVEGFPGQEIKQPASISTNRQSEEAALIAGISVARQPEEVQLAADIPTKRERDASNSDARTERPSKRRRLRDQQDTIRDRLQALELTWSYSGSQEIGLNEVSKSLLKMGCIGIWVVCSE